MLRSSRLIVEKTDALVSGFIKNHQAVRKGDTMTGWEIIAGLPVEEQKKMFICNMPDIMQQAYENVNELLAVDGLCVVLSNFYRWNGESWEVVE